MPEAVRSLASQSRTCWPAWYGEILDVLQAHAGETGENEDALSVVRRLSQAPRTSTPRSPRCRGWTARRRESRREHAVLAADRPARGLSVADKENMNRVQGEIHLDP